jgi:hypothetical protein
MGEIFFKGVILFGNISINEPQTILNFLQSILGSFSESSRIDLRESEQFKSRVPMEPEDPSIRDLQIDRGKETVKA